MLLTSSRGGTTARTSRSFRIAPIEAIGTAGAGRYDFTRSSLFGIEGEFSVLPSVMIP